MKRAGRDATRRNRNIGTAKAGHGKDNRLWIPGANRSRAYWSQLEGAVRFQRNGFTFLVEPCQPGFVYSVTVDDLERVLGLLPTEDVARIRVIALRQPTRKQRTFASVWGRFAYFADFGDAQGPAIILESQPVDDVFEYPSSLRPDAAEELEQLRRDGHAVTKDKGGRVWRVETSRDSSRRTVLYRTFAHEVGHGVHFVREVREAAGGDCEEEARLRDLFFARPQREREDFANRYAREFYDRMREAKRMPFDRLVDVARIKRCGLQPEWFGVTDDA